MIDIKAKIHDKFSVEFKVGFVADGERGNDFAINTWIFLPNSLDINPATYGKEDFYRDVKSNVRFITPIFPLGEIAGGGGPRCRWNISAGRFPVWLPTLRANMWRITSTISRCSPPSSRVPCARRCMP